MRLIKTITSAKQKPLNNGFGWLMIGPGFVCNIFFLYTGFIFLLSEDKRLPGFSNFLTANWNSVFEVQIKKDNDAFKKLPVWIQYNTDYQPTSTQLIDVKGLTSYDQIQEEGPWPEAPYAAFKMHCNDNWSLDGMFKGTNTDLGADEYALAHKGNTWSFLVSKFNAKIGEFEIKTNHGTKTLPSVAVEKLQYCIFRGVSKFNATDESINTMKAKLQRLGVMGANQKRSYIWDENNKVNYEINSAGFASNLTDLIQCPQSSCFDGTAPCKCAYKPGVLDVVTKWDQLLAITAKGAMGKRHLREINLLIRIWDMFFLAILLYPQGQVNGISKWFFHKNLALLVNIWNIARTQNFLWEIVKFIEPVCLKNPANPNPIYWDAISSYIPGWNCLEYHLRIEYDTNCFMSLLLIINILVIRTRRKKSTNASQSPYEEVTGKDLDGNRIHYFTNESDDENDTVELRNERQVNRSIYFTRELPEAQRCADINYGFYKIFFFYFLMIGMLLYGTIGAFFAQIKVTPGLDFTMIPNPLGIRRFSWIYSIWAWKQMIRKIESTIVLCCSAFISVLIVLDKGLISANLYDIHDYTGRLCFFRAVQLVPIAALFKTVQGLPIMKGVTVAGVDMTSIQVYVSVALAHVYLSRLVLFVWLGSTLNLTQSYLGRYNRSFYSILKWIVIFLFIIMVCSAALYLCACGIQSRLDMAQQAKLFATGRKNGPHQNSYVDVCKDPSGNLAGWAGYITDNLAPTAFQNWAQNQSAGYVHYSQYYTVDMVNELDTNFVQQDYEAMRDGVKGWYSPYLDDIQWTLLYTASHALTTAGLGDIPPVNTLEKIVVIVFTLVAIFFAQTNLLQALSQKFNGQISTKTAYILNSYGSFFVDTSKEHQHRAKRTQSVLWYHWDLWHGIMPLSQFSSDLTNLPQAIQQDLKFSVLQQMVQTKKSTFLKLFNNNQLRMLAQGLEYDILPKNDLILNSTEKHNFIIFVLSGIVEKTDSHDNPVGELNINKVHFEVHTYLGVTYELNLNIMSSYAEFFMIKRKHLMNVLAMNPLLNDKVKKLTRSLLSENNVNQKALSLPLLNIEETTQGLQGFEAPLTAHISYDVPQFSDIDNYIHHTSEFQLDDQSAIHYDQIDGQSQDILDTSGFVKMRNNLVSRNSHARSVERYNRNTEQQNTLAGTKSAIVELPESISFSNTFKHRVSEIFTGRPSHFELTQGAVQPQEKSEDPTSLCQLLYNVLYNMTVCCRPNSGVANYKSTLYFHKTIHEDRGWTYFSPDMPILEHWNSFNCLHALYSFAAVLIQFSFYNRFADNGDTLTDINPFSFYLVQYLTVDLIQSLDWVFVLRTGRLNDEHRLDYDWHTAIKAYSTGELVLKIVGTLPFELILYVIFKALNLPYFVGFDSGTGITWGSLYLFSEFYFGLRLIKLFYYWSVSRKYFSDKLHGLYGSPWHLMWHNLIPCVAIIFITGSANYYFVCTQNTTPWNGACQPGSWAWSVFGEMSDSTMNTTDYPAFVRALMTIYWKIKVYTTFSLADILPTFRFTRQIMFLEMVAGSYIVLTLTAITTAIFLLSIKSTLLADYKAHIVLIRNQMSKCCSPESINKVIETKKNMFFRSMGFSVNGIYECHDNLFPDDKIPIINDSVKNVLSTIRMFQEISAPFILQISLKMKTFVYCKGITLFKAGQNHTRLYYIQKGLVQVNDAEGKCLGYLEGGQTINQLDHIAGNTTSKYTFITASSCELYEWTREELSKVAQKFPVENPYVRLQRKCEREASQITVTPRNVNKEQLHNEANKDIEYPNWLPTQVEDYSFDPDTRKFFSYSTMDKIRLIAHMCLTGINFQFINEGNKHNYGVVNFLLPLLDAVSFIQVPLNILSERRHPKTNVKIHRTSYNFFYYLKNGLVIDIISIVPWDIITGNRNLAILRFLQIRQAKSYFDYIKNNISMSPILNFIELAYYQILLTFMSVIVVYGYCLYDGQNFFNANGINDVFQIDYTSPSTLLNDTIYIRKDSWLGVSIQKNIDGSSFRLCDFLQNPIELFILSIYFIADSVNGVGSGHIYPQSAFIKSFELLCQLLGLIINIQIAATFSEAANINDYARESFESKFILLQEFFEKSGASINDFLKENVYQGFQLAWREKTGETNTAVGRGLPNALAIDVYKEMYYDYVGKLFNGQEDKFEQIFQDFSILAVPSNTMIVRKDSLVDHIYFVGSGKFTLLDKNGNVTTLTKGMYFLSKSKKCTHTFSCVEEGKLLTLPIEEINFNLPAENTPCKLEPKIHHYDTPFNACVLGCIQFLIVLYRLYFETGISVSTGLPVENLVVKSYTRLLDIGMFFYLVITLVKSKIRNHDWHFNPEEYMLIAALLPLAATKIPAYNKVLWFLVLGYAYERQFNDIRSNIFKHRIMYYCMYALLILTVLVCWTIRTTCPNNVCVRASMAADFQNVFNSTHQIVDISSASVFVDVLYVNLVLFSATGYGSIVPQSPAMMLHHAVCVFAGRFVMGLVLGLSRDIAESALEGMAADYFVVRERIRHMLIKLDVSKYYQDYFTGYIDANFLRSHNVNLNDIVKGGVITPAVESDLYYELVGQRLVNNQIFRGVSTPCIREISARATKLENYFSGHVIQSQGSPVDGILLILEGAVCIGKRSLKTAGECVFAHHFYDDSLAEVNVYAFIRSEIVKLDKNTIFDVFQHYPEDEAIFRRNIDSCKDKSLTNLIPRETLLKQGQKPDRMSILKATSVASNIMNSNVVHPM